MSAHFAKPDMTLSLAGGSLLSRVGHAVAGIVQYVAEMPRRRAVLNELSLLSDRELADIGISRAEVGHVFDASFRG